MKRVVIEFSSSGYLELFTQAFYDNKEWHMVYSFIGIDWHFVTILPKQGFENEVLPSAWSCIYDLKIEDMVIGITIK